jgi:hypothetical protein
VPPANSPTNHTLDITTLEGWLWEAEEERREADEKLKKVLAGLGLGQ